MNKQFNNGNINENQINNKQTQNQIKLTQANQTLTLAKQIQAKIQNNLISLTLQELCHLLKQYRNIMKPPVHEENAKYNFSQFYDTIIIKKTLDLITKFIKQQRNIKKSQVVNIHGHICQECLKQQQDLSVSNRSTPSQCRHIKIQSISNNNQLIDKLLLYTWQLTNFRVIFGTHPSSLLSFPQEVIHMIHRLCISSARIYVSRWGLRHVTMQAMQIAYFNLLKNKIFDVDPQKNGSLCCLIQAILGDAEHDQNQHRQFVNIDKQFIQQVHQSTQKHKTTNNQSTQHDKNDTKQKKQIIQQELKKPKIQNSPIKSKAAENNVRKKSSAQLELQWFTYIIQQCIIHCQSFIKSCYTQLSNGNIHIVTHSGTSFLHYISVLCNKIVNDRGTTQIVSGYSCHIQQVKTMYSRCNNSQTSYLQFKLSQNDYDWLIQTLLPELMRKYQHQIKNIWKYKVYSDQQNKQVIFDYSYIHCILNIISILNSCLFLGGYSNVLQKKTTKMVMPFCLKFLQLSYLIYELCHAKLKKISLKQNQSQLQQSYMQNLQKLIHFQHDQKQIKIHGVQLNVVKVHNDKLPKNQNMVNLIPLEQGQLVSIIRLLSNLVHINSQAQLYFQENLKYFRIIMSLTHEFESQLTMKNWAIVFLKNVSQTSQIMREQLSKLEVSVSVKQ